MARKDISMTSEEVTAFLDETAIVEVATIGRDGWPHLAPMWFVMEDDKIVFRSFTRSQKIVNLQRDPRLTVLAETGDAYEELRGVMIKAEATLIEDPAYVLAIYGRLAAKYPMVGPEPVDLSDEEESHCQEILDSGRCTCEALDAGDYSACGLSADPMSVFDES